MSSMTPPSRAAPTLKRIADTMNNAHPTRVKIHDERGCNAIRREPTCSLGQRIAGDTKD